MLAVDDTKRAAARTSGQKRGSSGLRVRQWLGKYRLERRLGEGGFATVFQAMDSIQGIRVALKIPRRDLITSEVLDSFRREVRTASRLDHENILPVRDASFIDDHFVIVFPLGERTLADRLEHRMSFETSLLIAHQILRAVAHAHERKIIHCDIKPENVILFSNHRARLTDFGIAKVARETVQASGTGTVGYMAPEQAMGKPSTRSDVFSIGLILYRMLTGSWPEWPFDWPPRGYQRLRGRAHPELIALLRRSIDPNPRRRFRDAIRMLDEFEKIQPKALRHVKRARRG